MISRNINCLICVFVAVAIANGYNYNDSETAYDPEATTYTLEIDNLESSRMDRIPQVKQTSGADLGALLDDRQGAVVTMVAGDTRLAAHRAVLAARSPTLATVLSRETPEASIDEISVPDLEGPVLRQVVAYLYSPQVPQLPGAAAQLFPAADRFGLADLKAACERQLAAELSVETAAATAVLAVRHSSAALTQAAVAFIRAHIFDVMATKGWADAMLTHSEDLLKVMQLMSEPPPETKYDPVSPIHRQTSELTTATQDQAY